MNADPRKSRVPGKVQFIAYIDPVSHRQLKVHAAQMGTSMSALVERAIGEIILKDLAEKKAAA